MEHKHAELYQFFGVRITISKRVVDLIAKEATLQTSGVAASLSMLGSLGDTLAKDLRSSKTQQGAYMTMTRCN